MANDAVAKNATKKAELKSALFSIEKKGQVPDFVFVNYINKRGALFISQEKETVDLSREDYNKVIKYKIIPYNNLMPTNGPERIDSLIKVELTYDFLEDDKELMIDEFMNSYTDGQMESGKGYLKEIEGYNNLIMIEKTLVD